jgi:hypothetical protein
MKNPHFARVSTEISLFEALAAIEHFAESIPEDRCSRYVSDRLEAAAKKIADKADATRDKNAAEAAAKRDSEVAPAWHELDAIRHILASHTPREELRDGKPYCGMCQTPGCPWCFPKLDTMSTFTVEPPVFIVEGCISGRFDSSKPNKSNTPQECWGGDPTSRMDL